VASKIGAPAHWVVVEQEETLCRHKEHFWDLPFIVLIISDLFFSFFLSFFLAKTGLVLPVEMFLLIEQHGYSRSVRTQSNSANTTARTTHVNNTNTTEQHEHNSNIRYIKRRNRRTFIL